MPARLLIIVLTVLAYLPVMHGGFVWDDDSWTTGIKGLLRDVSGLRSMWCQLTALQQYYPLSGTTFWLDYHLWGFWTLPYHAENVLLHAASAVLFWQLLRRLETPGAWLAGAVFALHPVMVESVGWITERKNVLSLVLYLGALLAYGRFNSFWKEDNGSRARHRGAYALALFLCLGALLAKTTAFSLPAVIMLIGWWKRGHIRWRDDVLPTLANVYVGDRVLLDDSLAGENARRRSGAGLYPGIPGTLSDRREGAMVLHRQTALAGQFLFCVSPVAPRPRVMATMVVSGGHHRHACRALAGAAPDWTRAGDGGILFRGHTFPTAGILQRVWDALLVRVEPLGLSPQSRPHCAGRGTGRPRGCRSPGSPGVPRSGRRRAGGTGNTHMESGTQLPGRGNTLARYLGEKSPCWMAHNNLGLVLEHAGMVREAIGHYEQALRIQPEYAEAHNNLGMALAQLGRMPEAVAHWEQALRIKPHDAEAYNNLGDALLQEGKVGDAIGRYEQALRIRPDFAEAHRNLGIALQQTGKIDKAIAHFEQALRIDPDYAEVHYSLGIVLQQAGRVTEAREHYEQALRIRPDYADAHDTLGTVFLQEGKLGDAIGQYEQALRIKPDSAEAHYNLGLALARSGR